MRDTSLESYSTLKLDLGKIQEEILKAIIELNLMGRHPTDRELAKDLGYTDPNRVRPRRHESWKDGYVVEMSRRPRSVTGRSALTWGLSHELREILGLMEGS